MSPAEIFDLLTSNETPDFKQALKAFLITCIGAVLMIVFFGVCEWYGLNYLTF